MKRLLFIVLISIISVIVYAPVCHNDVIYIIEGPVMNLYTPEFIRYADKLGYEESRNNPRKINKIGCFGEHQWKQSTLQYLGYNITLKKFKRNPDIFPKQLQLEALKALTDANKAMLKSYEFYIGSRIRNTIITHSGLLAACHLAGFNNVRLFLITNGKINKRDIFGTSVKDYINKFQGYNI